MAESNQNPDSGNEIPEETRSFERIIASIVDAADAIDAYEKRMSVVTNEDSTPIIDEARTEKIRRLATDLELLIRENPAWREALAKILFTSGELTACDDAIEADPDTTTG